MPWSGIFFEKYSASEMSLYLTRQFSFYRIHLNLPETSKYADPLPLHVVYWQLSGSYFGMKTLLSSTLLFAAIHRSVS